MASGGQITARGTLMGINVNSFNLASKQDAQEQEHHKLYSLGGSVPTIRVRNNNLKMGRIL